MLPLLLLMMYFTILHNKRRSQLEPRWIFTPRQWRTAGLMRVTTRTPMGEGREVCGGRMPGSGSRGVQRRGRLSLLIL
uniref:Uncharacterized protein n=1 Tax=Arundo donax TaxID=35708 RepID=A0A0A9FZE2_ARUDO